MEQLFFAGKAYLKINSLVKTPLHEFMAVERSRLWAPEISKWPSLSGPHHSRMRFYDSLNFLKNKKICMEKVVGEQGLALQQHFPYKSS